jgi:hypothetical protein
MATPAPAPARAPSRMTLANVVRGKVQKPMRILLYGVEKIGKSSFAASAPEAVFICAEDGVAEIDCQKFPEPRNWPEVLEALESLRTGDHSFKYVVVDTVDWLEPMIWSYICERDGERNIESYGYGRGYTSALDEWRILLARLERLRSERAMGVILLAHSWTRTFKNPAGQDFDRFEMKMHAKAGGLLKEWSDCVLFAAYEQYTHEDKNKRVRGVSTGARLIYTQRTAVYDAGNRYNLPPELPLDWHAFVEAIEANRPAEPATIRARIAEMLSDADPAFKARVEAAVQNDPNNAAYLARVMNRLAATLSTQENAK